MFVHKNLALKPSAVREALFKLQQQPWMGSVGGSAKNYSPFDVLSRNQYLLFHETVSDFAAIKGLSKNDRCFLRAVKKPANL